jgi:hypothetical protein
MDRSRVKPLEGWMSIFEAMHVLGLRKQAIHKLLWELDYDIFRPDDIRTVGDKPLYIIRTSAVYEVKEIRDRAATEREATRQFEEEFKRFDF